MKKIIQNIVLLVAFCSCSFSALAQNPVVLSPTNNKSLDELNCWELNDVGYLLSGSTRFLYNKDIFKKVNGISSPWIKFNNSGKIKWTVSTDNGGIPDSSKFALIKTDVNNNSDTIFTKNIDYGTNYILESTVNFSGIYKVRFVNIDKASSHYSTNIMLSGISIDGDYWSSPSNNCAPKSLVNNDRDGDGVENSNDEFPDDPLRAFSSTSQKSTIMFEDQWPKTGDYDLNDVVIDYTVKRISNSANNLVEMLLTVVTRALGGSSSNGLIFQFDRIPSDRVLSVSGSKLSGSGWVDLAPNGVEKNQTKTNVIVYDNGNAVMPNGTGSNITNVELDKPYITPDTTRISIMLDADPSRPIPLFATIPNPYIIANQQRGVEIHLPNEQPSDKADFSLFGTADDNSQNAGPGFYIKSYKTANNLPWAIQIVDETVNVPYMQEQKDFTTGFLKFSEWVQSGGFSFSDWYYNKPGYRNNSNLYIR